MPKGQTGCFECGVSPTAVNVQVWLRDYSEDTDKAGGRRQHTVDSVTRRFCMACGEKAFADAAAALERQVAKYHGCARCGERTTNRIQAWMRENGGKSLRVASAGYCEPCGDEAYSEALAPLGPDSWQPTGQRSGDLSAARARQERR